MRQYLVFHLNSDKYGLTTRDLIRVLPLMELKDIPGTPDYVAGLMNLHGDPVPVIDLSALACGTRHQTRYDTRMLLVRHMDKRGGIRRLGLIAEGVAGLTTIDSAQFAASGVANNGAPYLGQVSAQDGAMLQLVDIHRLLPEHVQDLLFASEEQGAR